MKLCEVYQVLEELAPMKISDSFVEKYGAYDHSGVMIDTGKEVKKVLFSLDFSQSAIEKAKALSCDLIVTHHPAIYTKIGEIKADDFFGKKIVACLENGISVVSMHLNLDGAQGGTDEWLMRAVCGGQTPKNVRLQLPLFGAFGYGRAYELPKGKTLQEVAEDIKTQLRSKNVYIFGNADAKITKATSFCGAGADENAVAFALQEGAQLIVSSDCKHHVVAEAIERGLSVIAPTHYATEAYGFHHYYKKISQRIEAECVWHEDEILF